MEGSTASVCDKLCLSTLTIDSDDSSSCLHPNRAAQSLVLVYTSDDVIRPCHARTSRVHTVVVLCLSVNGNLNSGKTTHIG